MTTLRQVLEHASNLAINDDRFDPTLGLQLELLALHAFDIPDTGEIPMERAELPDSPAGCVAMVFDSVIAMAAAGTWTRGDEFLLVLSTLRRGLPTEAIPT